jgi:hypothetical protein
MEGLLERNHQRVNGIKFLTWKFYFSCLMQSLLLWFWEKKLKSWQVSGDGSHASFLYCCPFCISGSGRIRAHNILICFLLLS